MCQMLSSTMAGTGQASPEVSLEATISELQGGAGSQR